jgi:hypothetical protein
MGPFIGSKADNSLYIEIYGDSMTKFASFIVLFKPLLPSVTRENR